LSITRNANRVALDIRNGPFAGTYDKNQRFGIVSHAVSSSVACLGIMGRADGNQSGSVNAGVTGTADGYANVNAGLRGYAEGNANINTGIYAWVGGTAALKYAGYFVGRMYVQDNIGVGTTNPAYKLTVKGTAWCSAGSWSGSDIRWKKNITLLPNPLEKVLKLRGVEFDWKREEFEDSNFPEGRQMGLIAQELEAEFPELVTTDPEGYKAIAYDRLSAVLLEAIKSQQKEIEELKLKYKTFEAQTKK